MGGVSLKAVHLATDARTTNINHHLQRLRRKLANFLTTEIRLQVWILQCLTLVFSWLRVGSKSSSNQCIKSDWKLKEKGACTESSTSLTISHLFHNCSFQDHQWPIQKIHYISISFNIMWFLQKKTKKAKMKNPKTLETITIYIFFIVLHSPNFS